MAENLNGTVPPPCLCGVRHWSTEREKCKFYERAPAPAPQPVRRETKIHAETKIRETKNRPETEIRADENPVKKTRGRPKAEAPKPWEVAGVSKAAYYRQKKA
jgi:hypothetical protein